MDEKKDEIIIGVNIPKPSKDKKKKVKYKKKKTGVVKKTAPKEKKQKARIQGNGKIFRNRMIKKLIMFFLVVIALVLFFSSSFFNITNVEINGNEIVSSDEIKSLLKLGNKTNIFKVNEKSIKKALVSNPYIADIEMTRKLPDTISIKINERKIRYMVQLGDAYVYLNNQGYILDISNDKKDVPVLIGISTEVSDLNKKGERLSKVDLDKFDILNRIYDSANSNGILPLISQIDLSDEKNFTLYLESEGKIVYLGNGSDLNTRMLYVNAILEQEQGIEGEIFVNVDLNNQNVFFREKI